jgi:hypothetical protein
MRLPGASTDDDVGPAVPIADLLRRRVDVRAFRHVHAPAEGLDAVGRGDGHRFRCRPFSVEVEEGEPVTVGRALLGQSPP